MTSQSVIFINSFGDHATFPHNLTASTQSQRSATANFFDVSTVKSKDLLLCNAIDKEIRNMSVAFREVFKEFNVNSSRPTPAGDTGSPSVAARFHKFPDVFGLEDQLLVSNDNIRPRSRAKTSITSYDIHKVSPCGSDWQQQKFGSESPSIHKHYIDDFSSRSHKDVLSPIPSKELNNESNNAQDNMDLKLDLVKRGKRPKKKTTFNNKARKGKHGRIFSTSTGLQEKRVIVASQHSVASSADKPQKPRISSEPPNLLKKHEFVPSMSDIRSQRAVKSRLQTMEKEAQKKQEKKREAQVRLEKQQSKDREKMIKAKQRREIYALNKIMTELENKRFLDFCQAKGLNKV